MKLPERGAEDCVDLLRAFNKEGVEYLIGGSMARSHYCSVPRVGDMDLVINSTLENATKVKPVLRGLCVPGQKLHPGKPSPNRARGCA